MYINKIEKLIDETLDNFYSKHYKEIIMLAMKVNFVKDQKIIDSMLNNYFIQSGEGYSFILEELKEIKEKNFQVLLNLIKSYVSYYLFVYLGSIYYNNISNGKLKAKEEQFVTNIVDISRNQSNYKFRVDKFFNSESNGNIVNLTEICYNVSKLVEMGNKQIKEAFNDKKYESSFEFLNKLGKDIVIENFKMENVKDENLKLSNISKALVYYNIYYANDRKYVNSLLNETKDEEIMYIDVIISKSSEIDYSSIKNSLTEKDIESGKANIIYDMLLEENEEVDNLEKINNPDLKIIELSKRELIHFVADDFLLYHKDDYKYKKISSKDKTKKGTTALKFIMNKINRVSELYNDKPQEEIVNINDIFDPGLESRKGIYVNHRENEKILKKIEDQYSENEENINDMIQYTNFAYVNFENLSPEQKYGFNLPTDKLKNAEVVRFTSFLNKEDNLIEVRPGSSYSINVVGAIFNLNKNINLRCFKPHHFLNTKEESVKNDVNSSDDSILEGLGDGLNDVRNYLGRYLLNEKSNIKPLLWLFNVNDGKGVIKDKFNQSSYFKGELNKIYDFIVSVIMTKFTKLIMNYDNISIQNFNKVLRNFNKYVFTIPKNNLKLLELRKYVYYKNDEIKEVLNLNNLKTKEVKKKDARNYFLDKKIYVKLFTTKLMTKNDYIEEDEKSLVKQEINLEDDRMRELNSRATCQHYILWDGISSRRKDNFKSFEEQLLQFIGRYVEKNYEGYLICKSCGSEVAIKDFVEEGSFNEEGRFVPKNIIMDVSLEEIDEYSNLRQSLKSIGKMIERVVNIAKITYLSKNSKTSRIKLKGMVKNVMDLLLIHNLNLEPYYKRRKDTIEEKYKISKDITSLFTFKLENNIFVFSTKDRDKDYFKSIKKNNILVYIILILILDMNDLQLYSMIGDRICNFNVYKKYAMNWLSNVRIVVNDKNDTEDISKYPVLGYLIFYMSCMVTKYNMWSYESENKKKFNPAIQKIIIYTAIDLLNSILEVKNMKNKKNDIVYDFVTNRYYSKLKTFFNNNNVFERIFEIEKDKLEKKLKTGKTITVDRRLNKINGYYEMEEFPPIDRSSFHRSPYKLDKKKLEMSDMREISNLTNCEDGRFHKFVKDGKDQVCELCNKLILDLNNKPRNDILEKYVKTLKVKNETKMKTKEGDNITKKEKNILKEDKVHDKNILKEDKVHDKNINLVVTEWTDKIQGIYGKEGINLESLAIPFLGDIVHDKYIFNHNHLGSPLNSPITIINKDDKIQHKYNHLFFKKDVFFYVNVKSNAEVYYDQVSRKLLGYKEKNKDYVNVKNISYAIIIHSIKNRMNMVGFHSENINIQKLIKKETEIKMEELNLSREYHDLSKEEKLNKFKGKEMPANIFNKIEKERMGNLKVFIVKFNKLLGFIKNYKFLSKYQSQDNKETKGKENNDEHYNVEKLKDNDISKDNYSDFFKGKIGKKYYSFLKNLKNDDGEYNIFDKFNELYKYSMNDETNKIREKLSDKIENMIISAMSDEEVKPNMTLDYKEINESSKSTIIFMNKFYSIMNKFMDMNADKTVKINLASVFFDIVNFDYKENNSDNNIFREETNNIIYSVMNQININERMVKEVPEDELTEKETEKKKDEQDNNEGETEHYDMEIDYDTMEVAFDHEIDYDY